MDHLLHYVEQNIFSFGPPNYSKKYRNAQNLNSFKSKVISHFILPHIH